jgi:hypothetical protein
MCRDKDVAAQPFAPLDGRAAGANGCVYSARNCLHSATFVQRLCDSFVALNAAVFDGERGLTLRGVIGSEAA